MQFADILSKFPRAQLLEMAAVCGLSPGQMSTPELIRHLVINICDERYLRRTLAELGEPARQTLRYLVGSLPEEGLERKRVVNTLKQLLPVQSKVDQVLNGIGLRCLVFLAGNSWREYLIMPAEVREALSSLFAAEEWADLLAGPDPGFPVPAARMHLYDDLVTFLGYVARKPPQLTQKGVIYKREMGTIMSFFWDKAEIPDGAYPFSLGSVVEFCLHQKLVQDTGAVLSITPAGREWAATPLVDKVRDVWAYCRGQVRGGWAETCLALLQALPADRWMNVQKLFRVASLTAVVDKDGVATMLEVLHLMAYAGLLHLHLDKQSNAVWCRWTSLGSCFRPKEAGDPPTPTGDRVSPPGRKNAGGRGRPKEPADEQLLSHLPPGENGFYLQPNYQILAPSNLEHPVRWQLEQLADLTAVDRVMTYQLSKESVERGLNLGWTIAGMMDFLATRGRNPVPDNVRYTLAEWGKNFGRLAFVDAFVLQCADAELAAEVRSMPHIKPLILGELSPTLLVIPRRSHGKAREALRQAGYMPRQDVITFEGAGKEEHRLPEQPDGLPPEWFDGLRAYPGKVVRKMIENAIVHGYSLKLDYWSEHRRSRRVRQVDPHSLIQQGSSWYLEGYCHWRKEERYFKISNIAGIQLVAGKPV